MKQCEGRTNPWKISNSEIFANIMPRRMSSKDPIGLFIDYTRKSIVGYHQRLRKRWSEFMQG